MRLNKVRSAVRTTHGESQLVGYYFAYNLVTFNWCSILPLVHLCVNRDVYRRAPIALLPNRSRNHLEQLVHQV